MEIGFLNNEHRENFDVFRSSMAKRYQNNKEYLVVVYIMAGNNELQLKMAPYFDTQEGSLDSEALFQEEDLSQGLATLAKLAVNLFNYSLSVEPIDLVSDLDGDNFFLAINVIQLRCFGLQE